MRTGLKCNCEGSRENWSNFISKIVAKILRALNVQTLSHTCSISKSNLYIVIIYLSILSWFMSNYNTMLYWHLESILEYHSKGLKLPRWGIFCILLTYKVYIFKRRKKSSLEHHTSCIPHHTSHIAYEFVGLTKKYCDQNSYTLQQFIQTNPKGRL